MATTEPPKENLAATPKLKNIQSLDQKTDPSRLHIISLLCLTLYSSDDEETTASALVQDLLDVCGGSEELLSNVLQKRFIDSKTPLHWIICNLKPVTDSTSPGGKLSSPSGLPPVLRKALDQCSPRLSDDARKDIELACCRRDADDLFQLLNQHPLLKDSAAFLPGADPRVKVDGWRIKFSLPKFLDSMLALESIHFKAILKESLYLVQFINDGGNWRLEITRRAKGPNARPSPEVELYLKTSGQQTQPSGGILVPIGRRTRLSSAQFTGLSAGYFEGTAINYLHVQLATRNSYIGPDRTLEGEIEIV